MTRRVELGAVGSANGAGPSDEIPIDGEGTKPPIATRLVRLADTADLFHTRDQEAFATVPVGAHRETWQLKAKGFRLWLGRRFYEQEGRTPNAQALQDALAELEGRAIYDGVEHEVHVRLAEHEGAVYLDLGDAKWSAVEITPDRWRVVTDSPVRFRRPKGLRPLPLPVEGDVGELRRFVNVADDRDWCLLVGWLVGTLRPTGPYPVLDLHGEQGSAKTTITRLLRSLVDPNVADVRSGPRDGHDLAIAATNGWVIALDNLSGVAAWLSDALCRVSTKGAFTTRELYTTSDETILDVQRPIVLNGIGELATRGDLLDRSLIVTLEPIPADQRRTERELWASFEDAQPGILGGLLTAVSCALRRLPTVELEEFPRMADFAEWVTAAEPALGWPDGHFMKVYTGNRASAHELTLEASLLAGAVRGVAEAGGFEGTATEVLARLTDQAGERAGRDREWPRNAQSLSAHLRRLAPNLRAVGVDVQRARRNRGSWITIPGDAGDDGDARSQTRSPKGFRG